MSLPDASPPQYSHRHCAGTGQVSARAPALRRQAPRLEGLLTRPLRAQRAPPRSGCPSITLAPPQCSWPLSSWSHLPSSSQPQRVHSEPLAHRPPCGLHSPVQRCAPRQAAAEGIVSGGRDSRMTYVHPTMIMPTCHRRDIIHLKISSGPGAKQMLIHAMKNDRTRKKGNLAPKLRTSFRVREGNSTSQNVA